jgi:ketosteroid isomerase-like protein
VYLAAAFLATAACQARQAQFSPQDETTVRGMFDATVANIRAGDWVTWSKQFAEDAVLQPPNAKPVRGQAAILAWGQAFPRIEELTFSDVRVSGEGDMAYGTSAYVLKIQGAPADTGKQLVVFRRSADGTWEIPAVSFSSDLALPTPAPSGVAPSR